MARFLIVAQYRVVTFDLAIIPRGPRSEVAVDTVHGGMPERRTINHGDFVVADCNIGFGRHILGRMR